MSNVANEMNYFNECPGRYFSIGNSRIRNVEWSGGIISISGRRMVLNGDSKKV